MPDEPNRKIELPKNPGLVTDLVNRVKLIVRLMGDKRVSPMIKLIPIGSALYFIVPDLVIGPLDDAAIIWLATYLFVELCPPDVVQHHLEDLTKVKNVIDHYQGTTPPAGGPPASVA